MIICNLIAVRIIIVWMVRIITKQQSRAKKLFVVSQRIGFLIWMTELAFRF